MKNILIYVLKIAFLFICTNSFCQTGKYVTTIQGLMDSERITRPIEKLYLHLDRTVYSNADTIWFKVYLLNADFMTASKQSGIVYVELDSEDGRCAKRLMVPVNYGLSWGNIALNDKAIKEGNYILRAYTNWMRNFGEDYLFSKPITITGATDRSVLVKAGFTTECEDNTQKVNGIVSLSNLDKEPLRLKDVQLLVLNGTKKIFTEKLNTGFDGTVKFAFNMPVGIKPKNVSVTAVDIAKAPSFSPVNFPLILKNDENIDLQFMPEGGVMLAGVPTKVGFKAVAESGLAVELTGSIVNEKGEEVTRFATHHKGMGTFEMTPEKGQKYTAEIVLTSNKLLKVPLPLVAESGAVIRVKNSADSLKVIISSKGGDNAYYIIGQARGVICYIERTEIKEGKIIRTIPQAAFPTGIVRFTLLNFNLKPLSERIVFVNRHDNLKLSFVTDKPAYTTGDSIAIKISVRDKLDVPVQGSFSASVTDDTQSSTDSLSINIANHLLLTSDLQGLIEDPGYYFNGTKTNDAVALDNLLLTQGWVGYRWDDVLISPPKFTFEAEPVYTVQGRVINYSGKPVAGAPMVMISKSPPDVVEAVTDADGKFKFLNLLPVDTASFMIQAKNKRGKASNIEIEIDRFKPPLFAPHNKSSLPWFVNTDSVLINAVTGSSIAKEAEVNMKGSVNMLKEVRITDRRKRPSNALGLGDPDILLDDADMVQRDSLNLLQILRKDIDGFGEMTMLIKIGHGEPVTAIPIFGISGRPTRFLVDGMPITINYVPMPSDPRSYINFLTAELSRLKAADVTSVEVLKKNSGGVIYITTRAGIGIYLEKIPGAIVYRPMAVEKYKDFYRPRYLVKTPSLQFDMRRTIHWDPNVVTDKNGNAIISFYAAGKSGTYAIKIEGTNMYGLVGATSGKIVITGTASGNSSN